MGSSSVPASSAWEAARREERARSSILAVLVGDRAVEVARCIVENLRKNRGGAGNRRRITMIIVDETERVSESHSPTPKALGLPFPLPFWFVNIYKKT